VLYAIGRAFEQARDHSVGPLPEPTYVEVL
jgi:hypothetical protein